MSKSLKKIDNVEVVTPGEFPHNLDHLQRPGVDLQTRLTTTGQIKSELGKLYRGVRNGKIDLKIAYVCQSILRIMLKATEQEHMFQLAAKDPDADTPVFTGLTIIGPRCGTLPEAVEKAKGLTERTANGKKRKLK